MTPKEKSDFLLPIIRKELDKELFGIKEMVYYEDLNLIIVYQPRPHPHIYYGDEERARSVAMKYFRSRLWVYTGIQEYTNRVKWTKK